MQKMVASLVALSGLFPLAANATLSYRSAQIEEIQIESRERVGREDIAWLRLAGTWNGVTCNSDWGWFNTKTSPQLLAAALTVRATGVPVKAYVDDGYTKIDGYCHITIVAL